MFRQKDNIPELSSLTLLYGTFSSGEFDSIPRSWFVSMSVIIFNSGQFGYIQYILFYHICYITVMYPVELNSTSAYADQSVEIRHSSQ